MKTNQLNHLNKATQDAIRNGACAWVEKIELPFEDNINYVIQHEDEDYFGVYVGDEYVTNIIPKHKIGDKVYLAEEFTFNVHREIIYRNDIINKKYDYAEWTPASEMTYEQARHKGVVVEKKIVRVQDVLNPRNISSQFAKFFERYTYHDLTEPIYQKRHRGFKEYCKQLEINYDSNPYVVYTEIKRGE